MPTAVHTSRTLLSLAAVLSFAVPFCASCAGQREQVDRLERENEELRRANQQLETELEALGSGDREFAPIPWFTVGLAAAAQDFDSAAFEALLRQSLEEAAGEARVALDSQASERELAKIRGMLVQQYLAAEEIPIVVSNLSFRLADADGVFEIGGTIVSRQEIEVMTSGEGGALVTVPGELPALLRRSEDGAFRIDYEERGHRRGAVEVQLTDADMIASAAEPRAERQGDVSFNWRLELAEVQVYRVQDFRGDVGSFLRRMRIGGASGELSQYQTLQDSVFLFGYGAYRTDVVNQLRTPSFIDAVAVAAIPAALATTLTVQDSEEALLRLLGGALRWQPCEPVAVTGRERTWRSPIDVGLPFVGRQTSSDRREVFYSLYTASGTRLLGNFSQ